MPRYLCDDCKYDYGDACRRPERPNALHCSDYVPRDAPLWVPAARGEDVLHDLPVVTRGNHPEIRQARRERLVRMLVTGLLVVGAAVVAVAIRMWH